MMLTSTSDSGKFTQILENYIFPVFSIRRLSVVKKVILCRSNICVDCVPGSYGRLVAARQMLTVPGCWLAQLEQLRAGRPGACGDTWLILLAPCLGQMDSGQCGWERATAILQVCQSTWIEFLLTLPRWRRMSTMALTSSSNPVELQWLPSLLYSVS